MERIKDYEMSISLAKYQNAKCEVCKTGTKDGKNEMYMFRRHKDSHYLCRKCISTALLIAALRED